MARTTSVLVGGIIELDAAIPLDPFIEVANALVTEIATASGHDDTRLELIERWLSAHFYAVRDPRTTAERAGPVSASYESKVDLYLDLTRYGQMAQTLDTSGLLKAISQGKKQVGVFWGGTRLANSRVTET